MTTDRVFILGATGNCGVPLVKDLLANKVPTTIYVRNVDKANEIFKADNKENLTIIEGENQDYDKLKEALKGHTRLFLLITDFFALKEIKVKIASLAYTAGVQQIVNLSARLASVPNHVSFVGNLHYSTEQGILDLTVEQYDGKKVYHVALRPSRFISNILTVDRPNVKEGTFGDTADLDEHQEWASANDIAKVASNILQDPIEKHGNSVYELVSDLITPRQRVAIFESVFGYSFTYQQISIPDRINRLVQFARYPFPLAYDIGGFVNPNPSRTPGIEVLLGRKPESFEQYVTNVKNSLL